MQTRAHTYTHMCVHARTNIHMKMILKNQVCLVKNSRTEISIMTPSLHLEMYILLFLFKMNISTDEEAKTLIDEMEHIRITFTQVGYFTPNARFSHANFAHISSIAFTSTSNT